MAILLTGGTGKTATRIAQAAQDANVSFLLASRRGEDAAPKGMPAIKFDWLDASSYEAPFQYKFPNEEKITAVYLIAPEIPDPSPPMNAFIDLAIQKYGVKRFVLLAGSSIVKGGWFVGKVWEHLDGLGVNYTVILPTWFMGASIIHHYYPYNPLTTPNEIIREPCHWRAPRHYQSRGQILHCRRRWKDSIR